MINRALITKAAGWLDRTSVKPATSAVKRQPFQMPQPPAPAQSLIAQQADAKGPLKGPKQQQEFFNQMVANIQSGSGFPQ